MEMIFIRHTEKEETGEDPYLTKKGIEQAKHLANRLKKEVSIVSEAIKTSIEI